MVYFSKGKNSKLKKYILLLKSLSLDNFYKCF